MRILGFGTYDVGAHPRAGIVLDGLRGHGDDVVEVNEPLGISTAARVAMLRQPAQVYRLALRILARWIELVRRSWPLRRAGHFDAIFVGYLGQFDVLLARLLFPSTPVVLDMMVFAGDTARDRGVATGPKLVLLDALDRLAVRCADVVVLDATEQIGLIRQRWRNKAVVVPIGASSAWFQIRHPATSPAAQGLRVVFFGLYTPLQGTACIGEALARLADRTDISVTMIGYGQDYEASRRCALPNRQVEWLDWVAADQLPGLVAQHDVCLGIFGTTPKALRVVPNKVYEGSAAGCAIVTSDTPPQRRTFGDAAAYVKPGDAEGLAETLRQLADDPARLAELKKHAHAAAQMAFTPEAVVGELRTRLAP